MRLDVTVHPDGSVTGRQVDFVGTVPAAPPTPFAPTPVAPPAPAPRPPTGPVVAGSTGPKADGHIRNMRNLFNEGDRGKSLSAMYFEGAALAWKSKLQDRIKNEVFGGNANQYGYWADFRSYYPMAHGLDMAEATRLKAMAAQANAL